MAKHATIHQAPSLSLKSRAPCRVGGGGCSGGVSISARCERPEVEPCPFVRLLPVVPAPDIETTDAGCLSPSTTPYPTPVECDLVCVDSVHDVSSCHDPALTIADTACTLSLPQWGQRNDSGLATGDGAGCAMDCGRATGAICTLGSTLFDEPDEDGGRDEALVALVCCPGNQSLVSVCVETTDLPDSGF